MNYRQGDIFLKQIDALPKDLKLVQTAILAEGEVTGHKHKIMANKPADFRVYQNEDGVMYLEVIESVRLCHGTENHIKRQLQGLEMDFAKLDLHESQEIIPGLYEVPIERDYTPEGWRRVED